MVENSQGGVEMPVIDEDRLEELERQRQAIKRNKRIPYDLIDEAVAAAKLRHPDADEVRGKLYNNRVYVEVWKDGRADIEFE
jgi:hypothetical protein